MSFGAFIEILPGREGMCHVSQLASCCKSSKGTAMEALEEDESDSEETLNAETETVDPEEAELEAMIAEEEREKATHQEKEAEDSEKNTPPTTEEHSENVY